MFLCHYKRLQNVVVSLQASAECSCVTTSVCRMWLCHYKRAPNAVSSFYHLTGGKDKSHSNHLTSTFKSWTKLPIVRSAGQDSAGSRGDRHRKSAIDVTLTWLRSVRSIAPSRNVTFGGAGWSTGVLGTVKCEGLNVVSDLRNDEWDSRSWGGRMSACCRHHDWDSHLRHSG